MRELEAWTWPALVWFAWLFLALGVATGCAAPLEPPPTYGVDPRFTEEQESVVEDVFSAWCDAVGYCPKRDDSVIWGSVSLTDADFEGVADCPPGRECIAAGRNMGGYIVLLNRPNLLELDRLWIHLAHEVGHYRCGRHTHNGLMAMFHDGSDVALEIDATARRFWRAGC